jgi:hypothetical protein
MPILPPRKRGAAKLGTSPKLFKRRRGYSVFTIFSQNIVPFEPLDGFGTVRFCGLVDAIEGLNANSNSFIEDLILVQDERWRCG